MESSFKLIFGCIYKQLENSAFLHMIGYHGISHNYGFSFLHLTHERWEYFNPISAVSKNLSKNAVSAFQISCKLLSFAVKDSFRNQQIISALPRLKAVSTILNIMYYNLLPQQWIDKKFDVEWKYLVCFIIADTAFLLGTADMVFKKQK